MTTYSDERSADSPEDEVGTRDAALCGMPLWRDAVGGAVGGQADGEPLIGAVLDLVHDLDQQVAHLKVALATNRRIGIAIGIVMCQFRISEGDAFTALRHVSQNRNRKLRDVAEDVISAGLLVAGG